MIIILKHIFLSLWSGNVECGSKCDRTFVSQERQTKIDPSNVNFLERARRRCFCFLVILLHVTLKPFLPVLFSWYRYFWGNKATLANGKAAAFLNRSRTIRKGTNRGAETFLFFTLCLLQLATLIDVLSLPPTQLGDLRKKLYFWISILATLSSFVAHTQPDWGVWCMWQNWRLPNLSENVFLSEDQRQKRLTSQNLIWQQRNKFIHSRRISNLLYFLGFQKNQAEMN